MGYTYYALYRWVVGDMVFRCPNGINRPIGEATRARLTAYHGAEFLDDKDCKLAYEAGLAKARAIVQSSQNLPVCDAASHSVHGCWWCHQAHRNPADFQSSQVSKPPASCPCHGCAHPEAAVNKGY